MISVKQVSKSFHGNCVLDHISFEIPDQTATALIGPNGIGKTTLLNILCGSLVPDSGEVTSETPDFQREIFTVLSGSHQLYAKNTVKENIEFLAVLRGLSNSDIRQNLDRYLPSFPLYDSVKNKLFEELSTGQKQLMILLAALVTNSRYLILDEPTEGLDLDHKRALLHAVTSIRNTKTILITSHDSDFITSAAERFLFLKDGQIAVEKEHLDTKEFLKIYEALYLQGELL